MPTIDNTTHRSPNKTPRHDDIWALVIHSCEGKPLYDEQQSSIPWLCNPASEVSSDFYITREGIIYELVGDTYYAWHAGDSMLSGVRYCNTYSRGIELEHHEGTGAYPKVQKDALTWLCKNQIAKYVIKQENIATHRKVARAVGRTDKYDPTDWSDTDFYNWVASLYIGDPLRARTIPGLPNTPAKYTTQELYDFYNARGGLKYNGYPLADAFTSTYGPNNAVAIVQINERTVFKQSATYGVEQALLHEALAQGWIQ